MAEKKYDPDGIVNIRPGVYYDDWYGLYRERWSKDSVEPSSLSHPAKFARAMIRRVYDHCREEGWLKPGDVVVDPFGGVGLGALDAIVKGVNWVGVEVEAHHHTRGNGGWCDGEIESLETSSATRRGWYIKVDAEEGELYGDADLAFEASGVGAGFKTKDEAEASWNDVAQGEEYSDMTLVGFEYKTFKDKIAKPAICGASKKHDPHAIEGNIPRWKRMYGRLFHPFGDAVLLHGDSRYLVNVLRNSADQIPFMRAADLGVSSPPFLQTSGGTNVTASAGPLADPSVIARHAASNAAARGYGESGGQVEAMPEGDFDQAVSSPPFTGTSADGGWQMLGKYAKEGRLTVKQVGGDKEKSYKSWSADRDTSYGTSEGQLAGMKDEGFDEATKEDREDVLRGRQEGNDREDPGVLQRRDVSEHDRVQDGDERSHRQEGPGRERREGANEPGDPARAGENGGDCSTSPTGIPDEADRPESRSVDLDGIEQTSGGEGHWASMTISSPPYADISQSGGTRGLIEHGTGLTQGARAFDEYGSSDGQAGRMAATDDGFNAAISSPPYADTRITGNGDEGDTNLRNPDGSFVRGSEGWELRKALGGRYGDNDGQLANMRPDSAGFDMAASSPPFEAVTSDRPSKTIVAGGLRMGSSSMGDGYGDSEGQIGNKFGEDFWTASRMILDNLMIVLKPGAHASFVVKRFVKGGQIEDFPEKWTQLCEAAGFKVVHWHKAWVVEDMGTQYDLFGNAIHKTKERKSFFRKLAEKKGSPRIDFEEIVCVQKPYSDGSWDIPEGIPHGE